LEEYLPIKHASHTDAPLTDEYSPIGHDEQVDEEDAPVIEEY